MNPPDSLFSSAPGWSASSTATRRLCEAPERCRRWSGGRDRPTARGQWMGDTPRDTPAGWFIYHENPEMDDWSGVSYNKSQHWPMSHLSLLCLIFLGFSWLGIEWGDTNATIWSIPRLEGVSENWYCQPNRFFFCDGPVDSGTHYSQMRHEWTLCKWLVLFVILLYNSFFWVNGSSWFEGQWFNGNRDSTYGFRDRDEPSMNSRFFKNQNNIAIET